MQGKYTWMLAALLMAPLLLFAEDSKMTTIILVRHAEKVSATENPDLSDAGQKRARELVHVAGSAGIRAIYTCEHLRTRRTAEALSAFLNVPSSQADADNTEELVRDVFANHAGQAVLVVGHSDTVPEIISVLGSSISPIDDSEYDNLYVVTATAPGKSTVVRLKYGDGLK